MDSVLRSPLLSQQGFKHGFSTRLGGVSQAPFASLNLGRSVGDDPESVAENHRRVAAAVGYPEGALFELSQVHGRSVRQIHRHESTAEVRREEGDGLLTLDHGVALGVRAADCLPLLLADPDSGAVAAVHSGWRGTAVGVASAAVQRMLDRGVRADQIVAAVFPHIRGCCFEVGDEVVAQLAVHAPGRALVVGTSPAGKPYVDLALVVRAQLTTLGMDPARIDDVAGCTRCEPERFFSYRREGARSGRHIAAIVAGCG
jgi:polyphenol oxidase